jgi:hypothetical protein
MFDAVRDRDDRSLAFRASQTEPPIASLVVYLRSAAERCIASFIGSLTDTTRVTFDGVADLIAGERSVVLDFSRVDEVDNGGADAIEVLVRSIRARGAHLEVIRPTRRTSGSLPGGYRLSPSVLCTRSDR